MIEIEKSSGNVYADLDLPDAVEMQIKSRLVGQIGEIIKRRRLTREEAAGVIGIELTKLSNLLHGQFREINEAEIQGYINRLGRTT